MPKPTAVMQVEGVLRKPVTGAPIDEGRRLYHGLAGTFDIVLVSEGNDQQYYKTWLGMEGFAKHAHVVYSGEWRPEADNWWVRTAGMLKLSYGYNTALFVIPDPLDATALIGRGYSTLLFTQASYALPEWMPDSKPGIRPWAELIAEVERGRALRAADKRMEDDNK